MSLGADAIAEMDVRTEIYRDAEMNRVRRGEWTQKDGTVIHIRDMTDRHIRNCIRMLRNKEFEIAQQWVTRFEQELNFREYVKAIVRGRLDGD